eukprot:TRINITY_DN995_c0_g1_i3.p1 TRINITY_DN995_c0_g1~~TRINITY_DN995_c0_g1_i3.p1  ORF type:complete len:474 (-),score=150.23 TRINITY_DN995_c0_g1_i3:638-2059(-)
MLFRFARAANNVGLVRVSAFAFRRTKKDRVPHLLKDPVFTRKGIAPRKKKIKEQYDLNAPHVVNPHLYFDYAASVAAKKEASRLKRAEKASKAPVERSFEDIRRELANEELVQRASGKLIIDLLELAKKYSDRLGEAKVETRHALSALVVKSYEFNLRELAMLILAAKDFAPEDANTWTTLAKALTARLRALSYKEVDILGTEKRVENVAFALAHVTYRLKELNIPSAELSEAVAGLTAKIAGLPLRQRLMFLMAFSRLKPTEVPKLFAQTKDELLTRAAELSSVDTVKLLSLIAKNRFAEPKLVKALVDRYVALAQESTPTLEQIGIVARTLGNLRFKDDGFKRVATKVVQEGASTAEHLRELLAISDGFRRLGIESETLNQRVEALFAAKKDSVNLRDIEQALFINRNGNLSETFRKSLLTALLRLIPAPFAVGPDVNKDTAKLMLQRIKVLGGQEEAIEVQSRLETILRA